MGNSPHGLAEDMSCREETGVCARCSEICRSEKTRVFTACFPLLSSLAPTGMLSALSGSLSWRARPRASCYLPPLPALSVFSFMDLPVDWQARDSSDRLSGSRADVTPQQNVLSASGQSRKGAR